MNVNDVADAIIRIVNKRLSQNDTPITRTYIATFVQNNAIDSNLCDIRMQDGTLVDGCPRQSGTTYTAGDLVVVTRGQNTPLIVNFKMVGDINAINP